MSTRADLMAHMIGVALETRATLPGRLKSIGTSTYSEYQDLMPRHEKPLQVGRICMGQAVELDEILYFFGSCLLVDEEEASVPSGVHTRRDTNMTWIMPMVLDQ
jgi:hypothetical protein